MNLDPESCLLQSVYEVLVLDAGLGLGPETCSVQDDGLPVPSMGQLYVVVSPGPWGTAEQELPALGDVIGVDVTVWVRAPVVPNDADGELLLGVLNPICRKVRLTMDGNYTGILARANALLVGEVSATSYPRFFEPLRFRSVGRVQHSDHEIFGEAKPPKGYHPLAKGRTVSFAGARCG